MIYLADVPKNILLLHFHDYLPFLTENNQYKFVWCYSVEISLFTEKKDEEVSVLDTIVILYKLLSTKEDFLMMLWVIFLLSVSFYLDLESQLLTGQVMGILPSNLLHNNTEINRIKENWYAKTICHYIINCGEEGKH